MAGTDTVGQLKRDGKQEAFLKAFAGNGNVRLSCEIAKVGRATHYEWLKADVEYAARFKSAQEDAAEALEEEARRRAVEGVLEPAGWYQGSPGGNVRRYSDTLLIFLLKGAKPEKYRERTELTGKDGGPIETSDVSLLTDDERAERIASLLARAEARRGQ